MVESEMFVDGQVVVLWRIVFLYFQSSQVKDEFLSFLSQIFELKIHYLREHYRELHLIDFEMQFFRQDNAFIEFPEPILKMVRKEKEKDKQFSTPVDIKEPITEIMSQKYKKHYDVLGVLFTFFVKTLEFLPCSPELDKKFQTFLFDIVEGIKGFKSHLMTVIKILFLYSHGQKGFTIQPNAFDKFTQFYQGHNNSQAKGLLSSIFMIHLGNISPKKVASNYSILQSKNLLIVVEMYELFYKFFDKTATKSADFHIEKLVKIALGHFKEDPKTVQYKNVQHRAEQILELLLPQFS